MVKQFGVKIPWDYEFFPDGLFARIKGVRIGIEFSGYFCPKCGIELAF